MKYYFKACKISLLVFYSLLILICPPKLLRAQTEKVRVDPRAALGSTASQFFGNIEYIPLETKKNSLFGRVDQLAVSEQYFVVLDYDTNSILFFLRNGKFYSRIYGGDASKQFSPLGIRYFVLDEEKKEVSFAISSNEVMVYAYDGKFLRKDKSEFNFSDYTLYENDRGFYAVDKRDNSGMELMVTENKRTYKNMLNRWQQGLFTPGDYIGQSGTNFYKSSGSSIVYFSRSFDYKIYQLEKDTIKVPFSFIFPAATALPPNFTTDSSYKDRRFPFIRQNPKLIYAITHFYNVKERLYFSTSGGSSNNYSYDQGKATLYGLQHVEPDASNYYLPLFWGSSNSRTIYSTILAADSSAIYTATSAPDMFAARTLARQKGVVFPEYLNNYFTKESDKGNPVLIRLTNKEN